MANQPLRRPRAKPHLRDQLRPDEPNAPGIQGGQLFVQWAFWDAHTIKATKQIRSNPMAKSRPDAPGMEQLSVVKITEDEGANCLAGNR